MGQQQLLLLMLGVVIVGVAIVIGVNLFRSNAIDAKRNNLTIDLINLAGMAQHYYMRPRSLGGGSRSFTGWSVPLTLQNTTNGHYVATTVASDNVVVFGTGNEVVTGNDSVKVKITILADSYQVVIIK